MADPNFATVVFLLVPTGADGSTTFEDVVDPLREIAAVGDAQVNASELLLDGTGDRLDASVNHEDFQFGTGDFTVEALIKSTSTAAYSFLLDFMYYTQNGSWALIFDSSGYMRWFCYDGSTSVMRTATTQPVNTGALAHVAVSRVGSTLKGFAFGVEVFSVTDTIDYSNTLREFLTVGAHPGTTYGDPVGGTYHLNGRIVAARINKGTGRYTEAFTPPTSFETEGVADTTGLIEVPSMLGAVQVLSHTLVGLASVPTMLGAALVVATHDFTEALDPDAPIRYVADLVTPAGTVRVPVSSWQATLQTESMCYVQCVVPAATDVVADIEVATEFVVSRVGRTVDGGAVEVEMARAPVQTTSTSEGSRNFTVVISGYTDALTAVADPPETSNRTLGGVQSVTRASGNVRVRCDVDWLLRPGHRALLGDEPIIVDWINYYVSELTHYMDVGD